MRPGKNKVVLRPQAPPSETKSGIHLVYQKNENKAPTCGEVLLVGETDGNIRPGDVAIFFYDMFYVDYGQTISGHASKVVHPEYGEVFIADVDSIQLVDRNGIQLVHDRIIVERIEEEVEKTPSGIYLPQQSQKRHEPTQAKVINPGNHSFLKPGDTIYAHRYSFGEYEYQDKKILVTKTDHIAAVERDGELKAMPGYALGEYEFEGFNQGDETGFLESKNSGIYIPVANTEQRIGIKYMVAIDIGDNSEYPCEARPGDHIFFAPARNGHEIHWDWAGKKIVAISMKAEGHSFAWRRPA